MCMYRQVSQYSVYVRLQKLSLFPSCEGDADVGRLWPLLQALPTELVITRLSTGMWGGDLFRHKLHVTRLCCSTVQRIVLDGVHLKDC